MDVLATRINMIEALRARIASPASSRTGAALAFGATKPDGRLADGGLSRSALHEVAAAFPTLADDAGATLFVAGVAARCADGGTAPWAVSGFGLYAPGLEQTRLATASAPFVEPLSNVVALLPDHPPGGSHGAATVARGGG